MVVKSSTSTSVATNLESAAALRQVSGIRAGLTNDCRIGSSVRLEIGSRLRSMLAITEFHEVGPGSEGTKITVASSVVNSDVMVTKSTSCWASAEALGMPGEQ